MFLVLVCFVLPQSRAGNAFVGTNGCYYYQSKGNTENKYKHLQGQTLAGASLVLVSYANGRIEELDAKRQAAVNKIAKPSADAVPMERMESISNYLDDWANVSFEDKRQVVDALITVIRTTNEKVEIEWKI